MAFTLSPGEIKELREQFKVFDKDGSGTLSLAEFRAGMEKHAGMDPKSIEELFSKVSGDPRNFCQCSIVFCCLRRPKPKSLPRL